MRIDELATHDLFQYHRTLNPDIWEGDTLRPAVLLQLLKIAKTFHAFLETDSLPVADVVLTGSMANFNYTDHSDLDVHLIVDYAALGDCAGLAKETLQAKKMLWNKTHDIRIYGYPVELYAEDAAHPASAGGVYSLLTQTWRSHPTWRELDLDDAAIRAKVDAWTAKIDAAVHGRDREQAEALVDRLYAMRQAGLAHGGEFSTENIAFKALRNAGRLDALREFIRSREDADLSLEPGETPTLD